jgi:ribosomal protein S18 acetylase RimI-like enzyme
MAGRELPLPSRALSDRLTRVDIAYTIARMRVIEARPGNPFGVAVRQAEGVTALMARDIPVPSFNRIVGLRGDHNEALFGELDDWYRTNDVACRVDLAPGDLTPALAETLASRNYVQSGFHTSLYGLPDGASATFPGIAIAEVGSADVMEQFLDVYLAGWGIPTDHREGAKTNMRGWLGRPDWVLLLASIDGTPAAGAKFYLHDRIGYFADAATHPDFRGRGLQTALLHHRRRLAQARGAELIYSGAEFASASHRNMERLGMRVLHTRALWTKVKSPA